MKLIICDKPVSPWPLRVWLLMTTLEIPFEEELVPLGLPDKARRLKAVSPSGRLPVLVDRDLRIWDSLAIIEYLAETLPQKGIWPKDKAARAHARSAANEMHSGFAALRRNCIFNTGRQPAPVELDEAAQADVARIAEIWSEARERFGGGGSFLYGAFSAADAMYAPIVTRFDTFQVKAPESAQPYMAALRALPGWQAWHRAG